MVNRGRRGGGTRPWFCLTVLSVVLLASASLRTADAEIACPAPVITAPGSDSTLAIAGPVVRWEPVPGAQGYRVQITSRVPEGAVIANLDTLTAEPEFEPPQPLTDLTAIVRVTVVARCVKETGLQTSLRFVIDTRLGCPGVADPVVESSVSGSRLRWRPTETAERYEVLVYAASDGRLLGRGETGQPSFDLPGSSGTSAVAAVRTRCRDGHGPFAFAAY